jgi:hypothetical protein
LRKKYYQQNAIKLMREKKIKMESSTFSVAAVAAASVAATTVATALAAEAAASAPGPVVASAPSPVAPPTATPPADTATVAAATAASSSSVAATAARCSLTAGPLRADPVIVHPSLLIAAAASPTAHTGTAVVGELPPLLWCCRPAGIAGCSWSLFAAVVGSRFTQVLSGFQDFYWLFVLECLYYWFNVC